MRHFGYAFNEEELKVFKYIVFKHKLDLEDKSKPVLFEISTVIDSIVKTANSKQPKSQMNNN